MSISKQPGMEACIKKEKAHQTDSASKRPRPSVSPSIEATPDLVSTPRRGAARLAMAQIQSTMDAELITSDEEEEEEEDEKAKKDRRSYTRAEPRPNPSGSRLKSSWSERSRTLLPSSAIETGDDRGDSRRQRESSRIKEKQEEQQAQDADIQIIAVTQVQPGEQLEQKLQ